MAAVTANQLITARNPSNLVGLPAAAEHIYEGTLVFIDATTGYATGDDNGGANGFAGVAKAAVDNSGGSAGDLNVEVYQDGEFDVGIGSGFVQGDVGDLLYAVDNYTIQKSPTTASLIGRITGLVSGTRLLTKLDTLRS